MNLHSTPGRLTPFVVSVAWVLIVIKCVLATWALRHWQAPIHPGWVVWPTLAFGALATALWVGHRRGD